MKGGEGGRGEEGKEYRVQDGAGDWSLGHPLPAALGCYICGCSRIGES